MEIQFDLARTTLRHERIVNNGSLPDSPQPLVKFLFIIPPAQIIQPQVKAGNSQDASIRFLPDISLDIRSIQFIIIHFHLHPIQQILVLPDIFRRGTRIEEIDYKKNKTYLVRYTHAQKSQKNTMFVFYFNQQA